MSVAEPKVLVTLQYSGEEGSIEEEISPGLDSFISSINPEYLPSVLCWVLLFTHRYLWKGK